MDFFAGLQIGVATAFQPMNLVYCFIGVLIGTLIGVLPGIGTSGAVAILMPATFTMSPVSAIIMLAGIYYGAMYGGSTTSILVNIPGEAASVVTCFDGYLLRATIPRLRPSRVEFSNCSMRLAFSPWMAAHNSLRV